MDAKLKQSLIQFKKYCQAFGLKPTVNKELLDRWEDARGSMTAATFYPEGSANDLPPVAWVSPNGDIYMEHDENIIGDDEPAARVQLADETFDDLPLGFVLEVDHDISQEDDMKLSHGRQGLVEVDLHETGVPPEFL
jgi:hypothetical protein